MRIGIPKEIKTLEFRVGATPGVVGMRLAEAFEALASHRDQEPT